jgi:aminoglycoside 3-N-acetyltransferase
VLLLGVGFEHNTAFHLAEYRAGRAEPREDGAPIMREGQRIWQSYADIALDDAPFAEIGQAYTEAGAVAAGHVGSARAWLFRQRGAVDYAPRWLAARL